LSLTVPVVRTGGTFGVVEVQWNASVTGKGHLVNKLFKFYVYNKLKPGQLRHC